MYHTQLAFKYYTHTVIAFQNGISEWKCILEWNIYTELNGPYMGFRTVHHR